MIKGKKVILRLFKETDLHKYIEETENVLATGEFLFVAPPSLSELRKSFNENNLWGQNMGRFLITDLEDNLLGSITYFKPTFYIEGYELSYKIFNEKNRNKGYMTEALNLMTSFMFSWKNIVRLQILVPENNIASWKIAEKCGYGFEGIMRKSVYIKGNLHDLKMYSILKDESKSIDEITS